MGAIKNYWKQSPRIYILKNLNPYRTLALKSSRNSGTLPAMIAWNSWIYPVCPPTVWDRNSLWCRIVRGRFIIPPSFFTPHACPYLHHNHHLPLHYWRLRTSAHKCTFSVSVIPLQNPLHRELAPSSNCNSFMNHFSLICLLAFVSVINFSYHLLVLSCFVWYSTALIISPWLFGISLSVSWEKKCLAMEQLRWQDIQQLLSDISTKHT